MELSLNKLNLITRGAGSWQTVVLKLVKCGTKESKHLLNEYTILKKLHHEHIITPFKFKRNIGTEGLNGEPKAHSEETTDLVGGENSRTENNSCGEISDILVLEHAEKGSLMKVMKERRFKAEEVRMLFGQICEAVEYLHCNYIVHRDLKLENVFVCVEDSKLVCKLGDFGFASSCSSPEGFLLFNSFKGTKRGYMAPQIHQVLLTPSTFYDARKADIFALGVILFALFLGRLPFEYATMQNNLYKLIAQEKYQQFWNQHAGSLRRVEEREHAMVEDFKVLFLGMVSRDAERRMGIQDVLDSDWVNGRKMHCQA